MEEEEGGGLPTADCFGAAKLKLRCVAAPQLFEQTTDGAVQRPQGGAIVCVHAPCPRGAQSLLRLVFVCLFVSLIALRSSTGTGPVGGAAETNNKGVDMKVDRCFKRRIKSLIESRWPKISGRHINPTGFCLQHQPVETAISDSTTRGVFVCICLLVSCHVTS